MAEPAAASPWRNALWTVTAAAIAAFVLDLFVSPPESTVAVVARAIAFPVGASVAVLIGWWLGARTWPKRGKRLALAMLRHSARRSRRMLWLSDRADFPASTARRVLEVVGFAAGGSVILASLPIFLGLREPAALNALAAFIVLAMLYASFLLVPYWLFGRLGLRQVDVVRWLVLPMSRGYADRLRLSNGALLLIALGVLVNVFFRAGASQDEALITGARVLAGVVLSALVAAAAGVAAFAFKERTLLRELEAEALSLGVHDARDMSDNEFLPRAP